MICLTGTKLKIRFIYVRFNCKRRKVGKCVCYVWTVCFYVFCGAGSVFCVFFLCCIFVCKLLYSECAAAGGAVQQLLAMVSQPRAARDNGPGNHLCKRFTITLLHST